MKGQSQSEISEILAGRRVVSVDVLERVADGLGTPRSWWRLAGHTDDAEQPDDNLVEACRREDADGQAQAQRAAAAQLTRELRATLNVALVTLRKLGTTIDAWFCVRVPTDRSAPEILPATVVRPEDS
jgi:transcriptional regulator with XRE-family HTH domain